MQCRTWNVVLVLALAVLLVVAAAYEPIADQRVPSPKSPVRSFSGVARRLLQWGGPNVAGFFGGPYYTGPPYWIPGLRESNKAEPHTNNANDRRFDMAQRK